jgi:hypothetical protein
MIQDCFGAQKIIATSFLLIVDGLNLTLDDVGCRIKLVYTPVRKDGVTGAPKSVVSDVVEAGVFY